MPEDNVKNILDKYKKKIEEETSTSAELKDNETISREYETFRNEILEHNTTFYEHWCNTSQHIIAVKIPETTREKLQKSINAAHLSITSEGAASFATLTGLLIIFFGVITFALTYIFGQLWIITPLVIVLAGAFLIKPLTNYPNYLATLWRLQAGNQMVLCILYMVMYMRHTSNLEHALKFAAEHVGPPLNIDLKKIFWDVETGTYFSIKESLDHYLETWKGHNIEFIEAIHLIEGSLYEPTEERRVLMLEKSLQVMLDGTYNNMLHYAHNLKSPITILYMLGIILPVLGLVILPLLGAFLSGAITWYHLLIFYNIILPLIVYFMGTNILMKRPSGYGESDILKTHPTYQHYKQWIIHDTVVPINPKLVAYCIATLFLALAFTPLLIHFTNPTFDFTFIGGPFLDYKDNTGPYGFGALLISFLIPLGLALSVSFYYRTRTRHLITLKKTIDDLEQEFSGALFQLGNRVGDGIPVEMAFGEVSNTMQGTPTGAFFATIDNNIRSLGHSVKQAIFDPKIGAIIRYPSSLIESSMKVLIQSAKKGPHIVSKSLITISQYVDRIRNVNERLKDLLADILSSMTSQISFLTPLIAGIVVGVGSMVVTIINKLSEQFSNAQLTGQGLGNFAALTNLLNIKDTIPGFYLQTIIGVYVVQITIIMTILSTSIERGIDETTTGHRISTNLFKSTLLYLATALLSVIIFNTLANTVGTVTFSS